MKKSLIVAMTMALGFSATALAANPFSDLPAGHWAYGAVAKLAAEGVVDGYPDGTFKGDKTMTRYEMAQIVAKALAKGAIGANDKLVSEFADELDNLGVRIARLEKNADNVQITGEAQLSYADNKGSAFGGDYGSPERADLRTRLWLTGEVNDNWHYTTMLENHQYFEGQNESGDGDTKITRAFLNGNIGAVNFTAGRYDEWLGEGMVYDDQVDGIKAVAPLGRATHLTAAYGKMADDADLDGSRYHLNTDSHEWEGGSIADEYWMAGLDGDLGNLHLLGQYIHAAGFHADHDGSLGKQGTDKIWLGQASYQAGKLGIMGMYLKGEKDTVKAYKDADDDGWVASLTYGGAESDKPGSWGLEATYYDQSAPTTILHTMDGAWDLFEGYGFKGWKFGANLTLAKNMVAEVDYYDLKGKGGDNTELGGKHARTLWSQLVVTF